MAVKRLGQLIVGIVLGISTLVVDLEGAQAADPLLGKKKAKMCQNCHGIDGLAKLPFVPHIAGESRVYLVSQLKAFRSGARKHEIMSLIAEQLSDEDMENLAAWYSSILFYVTLPE